jgi:hypothetical protein
LNRNKPEEIKLLNDRIITDISSGAGHCIVIDNYGVAFSWGASADF